MHIVVRSGGQSGVDRAAIDAAIAAGVAYAGWCPRGGLAEDVPSPPGLLARYPLLRETPSDDTAQRTEWNVRDSDASLLVVRGGIVSPGTAFTKRCAEEYGKPHRVLDLDAGPHLRETAAWMAQVAREAESELDLNVAGPRESQSPGIYRAAYLFVTQLLEELGRSTQRQQP